MYQRLLIENYKKVKDPSLRKYKGDPAKQILNNPEFQANSGMIYRLLFTRALRLANETFVTRHGLLHYLRHPSQISDEPRVLRTLWDETGVIEFAPFRNYFEKKNVERIWRKTEKNELRQRTKFKESDSLILVNRLIQHSLSIQAGLKYRLLVSYFPSHNPYILRGISIKHYVEDLVEVAEDEMRSENEKTVQTIISYFESTAMEGDFGSHSLEETCRFNPFRPLYVPLPMLNNYLGTKLTLMFMFFQYFVQTLKPFLLPCFVLQVMLWAGTSSYAQRLNVDLTTAINAITVLLAYMVIAWTAAFKSGWDKAEENFKIKFGADNIDETLLERLEFKGKFMRNLVNDDMNFRAEHPVGKAFRLLITAIVNFGFISLTMLTILLIFYLKKYMIKVSCCSESVIASLPTVLISLSIVIFGNLYELIAGSLTIFENHKNLVQYENSKILNTYLVQFMSNFNSLFIYSFFESFFKGLGLCRIQLSAVEVSNDCSQLVGNQMLSTFLIKVALEAMQVVLPLACFGLHKYQETFDVDLRFAYNEFEPVEHYFEEQMMLVSYSSDNEIDGTLEDYMKLIVDISYISFFGLSLPLSFLLAFVGGVIHLHLVKWKLLFLVRRPVPLKTDSIGFWRTIIEIISLAGVIINTFYIMYTRRAFQESNAIGLFLFLLISFVCVRYFFSSQGASQSNKYFKEIVERHENNLRRVILKAKNQDIHSNITQGFKCSGSEEVG